MSLAIIGFGTQGKKRFKLLKKEKSKFYIVDPVYDNADFKRIQDLDKTITHAFVCTPDQEKFKIIKYLIKKKN